MSMFRKRYPSKAAKRRAERPEPKGLQDGNPTQFMALFYGHAPMVVMFGASWCAPCKRAKPAVAAKAKEHPKVDSLYLSLDDEGMHEIAAMFELRAVPALMAFRDSKPVECKFGAGRPGTLQKDLEIVYAAAEGKSE